MARLINTDLLGNPVNWVKVNLMVIMGLLALFFVAELWSNRNGE